MTGTLHSHDPAAARDVGCLPHARARDWQDDCFQLLALLLMDRCWRCDPNTRQRLQALECLVRSQESGIRDGPAAVTEHDWALLAEQLERYLMHRRLLTR